MARVKICGITNANDAKWAANLGADFVGLNFYPQSPRKVSAKNAKEIVAQLPPFIKVVGVFVDEPLESLTKLVKSVPLKLVQLHGQESPEYCQQVKALGVTVIKVLSLERVLEVADLVPYDQAVDYYLFDHRTAQLPGGTGETFDWTYLSNTSFVTKPWFLAGGLTPDNVSKGMKDTKATAVDVCSGVEKSPTRKDYEAMKKFIETAKSLK